MKLYLAEAHVLLDRVHLVSELRSRSIHVGDHGPDVADDGGKDEHADEEVDSDEEVLEISLWLRGLSDGGEGEGGPVEAVDEDVNWFKLNLSKAKFSQNCGRNFYRTCRCTASPASRSRRSLSCCTPTCPRRTR